MEFIKASEYYDFKPGVYYSSPLFYYAAKPHSPFGGKFKGG